MVKTWLLVTLLATSAANAVSFTAQLGKKNVALGEPVALTVQTSGLSLDALDVTPLLARFDVFARTLSRGGDSETLVLTLYPRMTGALFIPALQLQNRRTAALSLKVTDSSETMPRVTSVWTLEPAAPHVNQPARLTLAICDDGSLQWQRPRLPAAGGRLLRVLGEEEGEGERAGETCTVHRFYWSLIATQSGAATLSVPMLDASRFGQRLRFPVTELAYRVAALPAWLPAHVPPVPPHVQAEPLPARWPLNRPLAWRIHVTGGYSAAGLKALLELQLRDTPVLGMYPPLVEEVALDDSASPLLRYDVTLFMQPRARGQLIVPTLRLPWYDVSRGQLAGTVVGGKPLTVFDPRWHRGAQVAGGLVGVLLLAALFRKIRRMARWRLARRRGLRAIRQARDVAELTQAVRQFSLTEQSVAPSLGEWTRRIQQETTACDVTEAVRQLEQQQFGRASHPLTELQQSFLRALAWTRPKSPFPGIRFRQGRV
jgi:hypothetical protein